MRVDEDRPITITSIDTVGLSGPPPADGILEPGTQFGRYVIRKVLGEGGMGVVYAAFDPTLNRKIAIKVLRVAAHGGDVDTRSARARMLREAQAMAMCGHPNLVQVFDVGTYRDDVFIAMEFVEGETLRAWLEHQGGSDWRTVLQKYVDAGRGLAAAHRRNLIHRDFKPENVMVGSDHHVRVMDFGLARHTGEEDPNTTMETPNVMVHPLTQTGMIMGTPAYMAPEQFLAENTDHRTDQFAFCVALFEALYGYRPFRGDTMKALAKSVMRGEIDLPPRRHPVDDHVLTALLKGLQTEPEDRHDNMEVLLDALTTEPDAGATGRSWIWPATSGAVLVTGLLLYFFSARMLEERPDHTAPRSAVPVPEHEPPAPPPEPEGLVTGEQIARVLRNNRADVDQCIERAVERDPDVHGVVHLQFEIRTDPDNSSAGIVDKVILDHSEMFDKRAAKCVLGMAMNWRVPAPSCTAPAVACTAKVPLDVGIEPPAAPRPEKPPGKGAPGR